MATPSSPSPPPPPPLALPPPPLQDPDQNPNHPHQPPPSPSPPTSPNPTPPLQSTSSPPKKPQPLPWTPEETINLIHAYQEKWYSLKRGQLKAGQWEEVAVTVAARCGYDEPSKSAIQCRHKIEKLRKRYRTEKQKPNPNSWQLFDLMDRLERGPLPITVRPMAMIKYQQNSNSSENNEDSDSDVNYNEDSKKSKSKSVNRIVRGSDPNLGGGSGNDRVLRVSRNPMVQKRNEFFQGDVNDDEEEEDEEEGEDEEEEEEEGGESEVAAELAVEIKAFAERFVRMENKKIEMMRDTERFRMEMENKRMEMIMESQRKLVDSIHRAFSSRKKMKMAQ